MSQRRASTRPLPDEVCRPSVSLQGLCPSLGPPLVPAAIPGAPPPYVCLPRELEHGTLTNAETGPPGWARGQGQTSGMPRSPSKPRNNGLHTTPHTLKTADPAAQVCRSPGCGSGSLRPRRGWFSLEYHLGSGCGAPARCPQVCTGDLAQVCASGPTRGCLSLHSCGATTHAASLACWGLGGAPPASEWPERPVLS